MKYEIITSLEKQEKQGKRLAIESHRIDIEKRKNGGKVLKVTLRPESSSSNPYTPSIRVQGLWLTDFGFNIDDKVKLQVKNEKIIISHI